MRMSSQIKTSPPQRKSGTKRQNLHTRANVRQEKMFFLHHPCDHSVNYNIWAPVGQIPTQSPPLDDYDDYVNDDNDDEDGDIWKCLLLTWSLVPVWKK